MRTAVSIKSSQTLSRVRSHWLTDILLLSLMIGIFFFSFLGVRPLMDPDEARYAEIPREMIVMNDYVTPHLNYIKYFEKPPLFYWLQTGSIKLFGLSNTSLRLMTALLGIFGCLLTYFVARKLYNRQTGWFAALILATSGLYFGTARFITLDMAVSFFLTGALSSFLLGIQEQPGKKRHYYMWSLYIFSALAVLSKGLIGIIFPGMIIFAWLLIFNKWQDLKTYCLPSGILIGLLITAPWHVLVQLRHPEFFHFYFVNQQFARYLTPIANRRQGLWFFPAILMIGFMPWICFLMQAIRSHWIQSWKTRDQFQNELFLFLWASLIFLFFEFSHSQLSAYILPIFPPLAILVGHYLATVTTTEQKTKNTFSIDPRGYEIGLMVAAILLLFLSLGCSIYAYWKLQLYWPFTLPILVSMGLYKIYQTRFKPNVAIVALIILLMPLLLIAENLITVPIAKERSIYSLASIVKERLKPGDIVAEFQGYDQDLPFYLQRRIVLVDWGNNELDFGMAHQNMEGWFWTDQELWQKWKCTPSAIHKSPSCPQIFLFMSKNDYNTLLKNTAEPLYLLGATTEDVVVTNKP